MPSVMLELPLPPSANTQWRAVGGRVILSSAARAYRRTVGQIILAAGLVGSFDKAARLAVHIGYHPPDRRRRDLRNLSKGIFDSLSEHRFWVDDSQIDWDSLQRMPVVVGGRLVLCVTDVQPDDGCAFMAFSRMVRLGRSGYDRVWLGFDSRGER